MADKKISELTNITGANLADADEFVVVDVSADQTKAVTLGELKEAFDTGTGFVRITGDTMTGDLSFGDNDKAIFGAGSDLQIFHDGSDSYIDDAGQGSLAIRGSATVSLQNYAGGLMVRGNAGADTLLYHNGSPKLATTSTGIDVTGTVTADGLTVTGSDAALAASIGTVAQRVYITPSGTVINYNASGNSAGSHMFQTGNVSRLNIASNGDISFYEDTGTTPKFFWDASAESLGIGTSVPEDILHVNKNATGEAILAHFENGTNAGGTSASIKLRNHTDGCSTVLESNRVGADFGADFVVKTSDGSTGSLQERFRITEAGSVGIGTSSTHGNLTVASGTNNAPTKVVIENTDTSIETGQEVNNLEFYTNDGSASGTGVTSKISQVADNPGNQYGLAFSTYNLSLSEAMRIDSSGSVGIGTDDPVSALHVVDSGNPTLTVSGSDSAYTSILNLQAAGGGSSVINATGAASDALVLQTDSTEAMRIDSSGNLLVGKTSDNWGATGVQVHGYGVVAASRDGHVVNLNRETTDGDIARFQKNGSSVGSIASQSGKISIMAKANWGVKLYDQSGNDIVHPINTSGNTYDGNVSLGYSASRFKDLYLSGGVYLGGTGSANKLDDYEEGTWTPSIPGLTTVIANGSYTKAGDIVTAHFKVSTDSATDGAGAAISGLPFTGKDTTGSGRSAGYFTYNPSGRYFTLLFSNNTTQATFREDSTGSTVTRTVASGHLYWGTIIYKAF